MRVLRKEPNLSLLWMRIAGICVLVFLGSILGSPVVLATVLLGLCVLGACLIARRPVGSLLFLLAFGMRLAIVLWIQTPPQSDFYLLFDASQKLLEGDLSFLNTEYFQLWSYQMGFVAFQSLLLRLWNHILMPKLVNCLLGAATCVLVYLIARELTPQRPACFAALLYAVLPFPLSYVTVLSNQISASFLIYLGLYLLLSTRLTIRQEVRYLLFGLLLALANALRPESILPLLAVGVTTLLTLRRATFRTQLFRLMILVLTYVMLTRLLSGLFVLTGLSPHGLVNQAPHWKFVLGFNHDTMGGYSDADVPYLHHAEEAWELVKTRILVPLPQLFHLFLKKASCLWSGGDLSWSLGPFSETGISILGQTLNVNQLADVLFQMERTLLTVLYTVLALAAFLHRRRPDAPLLILWNQLLATFGVYLLIEVQPRYFYHIQISVLILSAWSIHTLWECLVCHRPQPEHLDASPTPRYPTEKTP